MTAPNDDWEREAFLQSEAKRLAQVNDISVNAARESLDRLLERGLITIQPCPRRDEPSWIA